MKQTEEERGLRKAGNSQVKKKLEKILKKRQKPERNERAVKTCTRSPRVLQFGSLSSDQ